MKNFQGCFFVILLSLLAGCVSVQPFPYAVRAGDTVTLAIGSLDNIKKDDMTITYFPDPGSLPNEAPVDVTAGIRSLFNIFPDKRSETYWDTTSGGGTETMAFVEQASGHSAWQTVVAVDLPATLPIGTGYFSIQPGPNVIYPPLMASINNVDVQAQILEAGGSPHEFKYRNNVFSETTGVGNLASLEQLRHVVVFNRVNQNSIAAPVAAAEYNLTVPIVDQFFNDVSNQIPNTDVAVILDDQISYQKNQTSLSWSRTGQNIKVIVVSPEGNQDSNLLRFTVLLSNYVNAGANGWTIADTAGLVSVEFFDSNGNPSSGLTPKVKVR